MSNRDINRSVSIPDVLQLAEAGFRVHPLRGKVPLLEGWTTKASRDPEIIRAWWTDHPGANVGVVTGDDGFFVLDVDRKHDGEKHLAQLTAQHGLLPPGPMVKTGGGGWHVYLKAPFPVRNSASKIAPGLDIRGVGGNVVAPPSMHASGTAYRWRRGSSFDLPIPTAPQWLLQLLQTPVLPTPRPRPTLSSDISVADRARRYLAKLPPGISGSGGHQATWLAALTLVRGFALPEDLALDILLTDFNPRCEPPWTERELRYKVSSASTQAHAEWGFLLRRAA